MGKYSRQKGLRGEQEVAKRLGGKRVGVAYLKNPVDIELPWADLQVKNCCLGGTAILEALDIMPNRPGKCKFVIFKAKARSTWLVVQTIDQFEEIHGSSKELKL